MAGVLAAGPPLILLYVEDDQITRDAVCTMVGRRFPELVIHTAGNGAEGLQRFLELGPDLVVTDIEMPVMHGIEMSRRIIALQSATPIIVTSAHRDMDYFIESIEIGISRYVMKPIDKDKLFAAIEGTLVTCRRESERKRAAAEIVSLNTHLSARACELETALRDLGDFRTLAENSPNIIIRYDREGRRLYVNHAYERETGYSYDQAVGLLPESNWTPTMPAEEYMSILRQTFETGVAAEMLLEWIRPDGHKASHAIHMVAELDTNGKVMGCLAIGHDITPIKEAEQRLAKLAENSPGAMYSFLQRPDGTSCMPYVSTRIEALVGLRPEELAMDLSEAFARIHPDDAARMRESIAGFDFPLFVFPLLDFPLCTS